MRISEINWGDDSAENDPNLLEYFIDSDAFQRLRRKSKSIVIGRKGSGKSALRKKLEQEFCEQENTFVVNIAPKLSTIKNILNNKDIVNNFGEEIFFQHTWLRQILLDLLSKVGDGSKGKLTQESWSFARDISIQLNRTSKDMIENITDVLSSIKVKAGNIGDLGIQLERELRNVADLEALEFHVKKLGDDGANFVVLVDDLDLGWDNSVAANNLLLGLLSTVNYLSRLSGKIYCCVFLREDVYSILISKTQHSDKYRNIEKIRWDSNKLLGILNSRINYNICQHLLPQVENPFLTVFPKTIGTSNTENWLIERTLSRPRELLQLSRFYTENIEGQDPDDKALKDCELNYSSWKLDDLCTEYSNQYPGLMSLFSFWKTNFFRYKYHLKRDEYDEMVSQIISSVSIEEDWFSEIKEKQDKERLLRILYEIGFIGDFVLGGEGGSRTFYSYCDRHEPRFNEIKIHPGQA